MPLRSAWSSARRSGARASARRFARRSAAPRSTSARVCSSRAGEPASSVDRPLQQRDRLGWPCGRARAARRRGRPACRAARRARSARARAAARRRARPGATSASTASARQPANTAWRTPSSRARTPAASASARASSGRCWASRSRARPCEQQRRGERAGRRRRLLPRGGQRRVGAGEVVGLDERVDEGRQAPQHRGRRRRRAACTRTPAGRPPRRRGSRPARTSAIARNKLPWASAISQPRGRATSISASHCASAASSSSSAIRCSVANERSSEPGSAASASVLEHGAQQRLGLGRRPVLEHARHAPPLTRHSSSADRTRRALADVAARLRRSSTRAPAVAAELGLEPLAQLGRIRLGLLERLAAERDGPVEAPDQPERAGAAQARSRRAGRAWRRRATASCSRSSS